MSTLPRLIPDPYDTFDEQERFYHRDVAQLSGDRLWAEQVLVAGALAERVFTRSRPRSLACDGNGISTTDVEWLRERREQLKSETLKRQRKGRAA